MAEMIAVPTTVKVAPFSMKRSPLEDRIKKDEEELEQMTKSAVDSDDDDKNDEVLSAEEKTFKKRYGDLRRYSQKKEVELQKQIDELREQLTSATKKEMRLPKSEEELQAWAEQFPDVYKIVETIAVKKARETQSSLEERIARVDEMERQTAREKAENELLRLHPDFEQIQESDEFHEWAEMQPKWVQQALYENDNDAKAAARAIDLYKADKGIRTRRESSAKDVASAVNTKGRSLPKPNADGEGVIRESEVAKMSLQEYEARQEEIVKAMRSGKFLYDISGNAR